MFFTWHHPFEAGKWQGAYDYGMPAPLRKRETFAHAYASHRENIRTAGCRLWEAKGGVNGGEKASPFRLGTSVEIRMRINRAVRVIFFVACILM